MTIHLPIKDFAEKKYPRMRVSFRIFSFSKTGIVI